MPPAQAVILDFFKQANITWGVSNFPGYMSFCCFVKSMAIDFTLVEGRVDETNKIHKATLKMKSMIYFGAKI